MRVRRPSRGAGKRCSQGCGSPLRAHPQPSAYEHFFFENASPAHPLHLLPAQPQGRLYPSPKGERHAKRPPTSIGGKPSCAAIPAGNASPGGIRNSARLAAVSPHSRMKRDVGAANAALEAPAGASTPCRGTFALSTEFVFNHMKFKMIFFKNHRKGKYPLAAYLSDLRKLPVTASGVAWRCAVSGFIFSEKAAISASHAFNGLFPSSPNRTSCSSSENTG